MWHLVQYFAIDLNFFLVHLLSWFLFLYLLYLTCGLFCFSSVYEEVLIKNTAPLHLGSQLLL